MREMQASDLEVIMRIENRAYPHPWSRDIFQDCLRVNYVNWVCELGEDLVGYAVMSVAAGEAHILNLCIEPDYQGQGLGRRLLKRVMGLASARNADAIFLEVRVSNAIAQQLYESEGFVEISSRRGYYPESSGTREDAIIYAKTIL